MSFGESNFSLTLQIWIEKPQVVHSHIFASKILLDTNQRCERMVYPKTHTKLENFVEIINKSESRYQFSSKFVTYTVQLENDHIVICNIVQHISEFLLSDWIGNVLQEKFNNWFSHQLSPSSASLNLVDLDTYRLTYERLKSKYGKYFAQNWTEKTDPCKFVYEDIGIASYLLSLWKNESSVHFVDAGCGNGLLTYLLVCEGFDGVGVDVRSRRIWQSYPESIRSRLKVVSIEPDGVTTFPSATWLIGNHSDELTPWLPILAARSGPQCKVFALPCCPFSLFGKFNGFRALRKSSTSIPATVQTKSRYQIYLNYLHRLFLICGFNPERDILRIPSTKRICIIGRSFNESGLHYMKRLAQISAEIERERSMSKKAFVIRPAIEPILNCSCQPFDVVHEIQTIVFKALLNKKACMAELRALNLVLSDKAEIKTVDGRWWNPGGGLTMKEAIEMIKPEHLNLFKSQHGGFQTILRNHHQCFRTVRGTVSIRWSPTKMLSNSGLPIQEPETKKKTWKRKLCWMNENHPDSCPYPANLCDFAHGSQDLHEYDPGINMISKLNR